MIMIGGDGASENRSCFKSLANKTARDILKGHYPDDLLEQLNLDFKIAFAHPNPEYAEAIVIFIGADMPHWVKKVRNAMDNKQTRDLSYNGCGLMLERLYGIHKTRMIVRLLAVRMCACTNLKKNILHSTHTTK